jgi:hypothetical protein
MKLILNNYYTTIIDPHVLLEGCCGIKHMNIFTCYLSSKGKQLDKRKGKSLRQTAKLRYLVPQNKTISIITPLTNILPLVKTHTYILLAKLNYISVIYSIYFEECLTRSKISNPCELKNFTKKFGEFSHYNEDQCLELSLDDCDDNV